MKKMNRVNGTVAFWKKLKFLMEPIVVIGICNLLLSTVFFVKWLVTDYVSVESELTEVKGSLSRYSFVDYNRGGHSYYIYLHNRSNSFQIEANDLSYFGKTSFEENVKVGDTIILYVSRKLYSQKVSSGESLKVYSIEKGQSVFMVAKQVVQNSGGAIEIVLCFICLFVFVLIVCVKVSDGMGFKKRVKKFNLFGNRRWL